MFMGIGLAVHREASDRKRAERGQFSIGPEFEGMEAERTIRRDGELALYALLNVAAVNRVARRGQGRERLHLQALDPGTIEEGLARIFNIGALENDIDRGPALAGARRDELDVVHHRPGDGGCGHGYKCRDQKSRAHIVKPRFR